MEDDYSGENENELMDIDDSDNVVNYNNPIDNEKKELAQKIKKENENFMKEKEQNKIGRLRFLLDQAEIFAHFLIGNTTNTTNSKGKGNQVHRKRGGNNNKIENVALLKSMKNKNNDDIDDMEAPQVTRLYYQPSILTGGKLTEYQLTGLNWLISLYETGLNGILADEMGLGKTIQSISFMAFLKQYKKKDGYFLVIVPKTTMPNWNREFKKWCPNINLVMLNPVKEEREEIIKKYISKHKFEVLLTSYEGVNICLPTLKKIKWECLIIDEAHRIKNENTLLSKNVRLLESKFRLLVTGTPLQNNLHELWALLNFLLPDLFSSSEDFDEWFNISNNNDEAEHIQEEKNADVVQKLHKILKPFLLRRTKAEVEKSLPPKKEIYIKIGLTEVQKNVYKKLLTSSAIAESKTVYRNIIMQLRKACNHPYLFEGVEDQNLPELGEHLINNSSKMRILDKLLAKLYEKSQVLIFSQMTKTLDIIEDYCVYRGYSYCRIDGNTSLEDRELFIQEFTMKGSKHFIFLLSTRAGGLGLNLMSADTVILYDSDWNPQVDLQAMDRVHRIGQTKPVLIYRLICENTIEERIVERQAMRLKLDSLVIQQGRVSNKDNFSKEEMKEMIQYGADKIFKPGDDFKDEDIDYLLERGEKETNDFMHKAEIQANKKVNLLLDMNFNSTDLYKFEDEDYLKKRKEETDRFLSQAMADEMENDLKLNRRDKIKLPNYNVDQNFDQLLNGPKNFGKKKLRAAKVPFFHFYDNKERLYELKTKQILYFSDMSKKLPEKFDEDMTINEGLTEEEMKELSDILATGCPTWEKKEYDTFIIGLDKHGRIAYKEIAEEIESKTPEEVEAYIQLFFVRALDLPDCARVIKNLEKKEKIEKQKENASKLISKKIGNEVNYENIRIYYPPSSNRNNEYSSDEDQYLVYLAYQYGYGNWDDIVKEIRICEEFMFNYFLKSRDRTEIQKRIDYLVKLIEKEFEPVLKSNEEFKKKRHEEVIDLEDNSGSNKQKKNK